MTSPNGYDLVDFFQKAITLIMSAFDELVKAIREKFSDDEVDIDEVTKMLESYPSKIEEWKKYRIFDNHKYTRNLVDTGNGKYNLMILCWGTGMASSIHDHHNSHCFVKVLEGTLTETKYYWPKSEDEQMVVKESTDFHQDSVSYMSDEIGLHRMENRSNTDGAVSLHLYIPPYSECNAFDERSGKKTMCTVTFHSKFGKKIDYRGNKHGAIVEESKREACKQN